MCRQLAWDDGSFETHWDCSSVWEGLGFRAGVSWSITLNLVRFHVLITGILIALFCNAKRIEHDNMLFKCLLESISNEKY